MAQYIPGLLTLLIISFLLRKLGKRKLAMVGLLVCFVAYLIPLLGKQDAVFVIISTAVRSVGLCGIGAAMFALLADTIDYGEWKIGLRIEGILFSAGTLGQMLGMGLGTASVGWILGAAGFVSGGNIPQSDTVIKPLSSCLSFFLCCWLHSIWPCSGSTNSTRFISRSHRIFQPVVIRRCPPIPSLRNSYRASSELVHKNDRRRLNIRTSPL